MAPLSFVHLTVLRSRKECRKAVYSLTIPAFLPYKARECGILRFYYIYHKKGRAEESAGGDRDPLKRNR